MARRVTFTWMWSSVGGLASLIAVVAALWGWGLFPATNGMVEEAKAQTLQVVAGLESFSKSTRVLTLQGDRRYYTDQLDRAQAALRQQPGNAALLSNVRNLQDTLRRINQQIEELRR